MHVVRPVRTDDLDDLVALAHLASFGLTTLPKDRDLLAKRIRESLRAFDRVDEKEPHGEGYLFVLEEAGRGRVVGTTAIVSKAGGFQPFWAYRIEKTVHESKTLDIRREIDTLHLLFEHDGPSEIGSLFLDPEERAAGIGRMLSLSRFLFMAEHPSLFTPRVIAEIRGCVDDAGRSPFWDAIGRHFFDMDYPKADYLSVANKELIGELMPRYPIYVPMLPSAAQGVIGKPHPESARALHVLESEGFHFAGMVDIFEAGPIVECARDEIRTVRESAAGPVSRIVDRAVAGENRLLGAGGVEFRACLAPVGDDGAGGLVVTREAASALGIDVGSRVRTARLRASRAGEARPSGREKAPV